MYRCEVITMVTGHIPPSSLDVEREIPFPDSRKTPHYAMCSGIKSPSVSERT